MTPAEVVSAQLDAYNARDIDAFAATYAEDACLYRMPHSELMLRGRQQIIAYYGGTAFKNTSLHAEVLSRQVVGNKVVDHERALGIRPEPVEFMVVYEVHGGLIQAVWFYDPHHVSAPPEQKSSL
jgi:hypothetical protein